MNFKINKNIFLRYLTITAKAISNFSPLPAFSGIKIEAENNKLILIASDSDISIKTIIELDEKNELEITRNGGIVLEAKYILELLRKIEGKIVQLELVPDTMICNIISPNSNFRMNAMRESDYPPIDFTSPSNSFRLESNILKEITFQTTYATSDIEARPVLTGVYFECKDKVLSCVATDSYRLAKKDIQIDAFDFNLTIPTKTLKEVSSILEENSKVEVLVSDKKIQFKIDEFLIQSRLIDGIYPNFRRLIPTEFNHIFKINLQEMKNAISRASLLKTDGISIMKLDLSNDLIELSAKSIEIGSSEERLMGSFEGNPLKISFNGKYVEDALKALINQEEITFKFTSDMGAFLIVGDSEEFIQLIVPIKTY